MGVVLKVKEKGSLLQSIENSRSTDSVVAPLWLRSYQVHHLVVTHLPWTTLMTFYPVPLVVNHRAKA